MILVLLILLIRLVRKPTEPFNIFFPKKDDGTTTVAPLNTPVTDFISNAAPIFNELWKPMHDFLDKGVVQLNVMKDISPDTVHLVAEFDADIWLVLLTGQLVNRIERLFIVYVYFFKIAITEVLTGQDKQAMINFVNNVVNPKVRQIKLKIDQIGSLLLVILSDTWGNRWRDLMQDQARLFQDEARATRLNQYLESIDPEDNLFNRDDPNLIALMRNTFNIRMQDQTGMMFPGVDPTLQTELLPTELTITDY